MQKTEESNTPLLAALWSLDNWLTHTQRQQSKVEEEERSQEEEGAAARGGKKRKQPEAGGSSATGGGAGKRAKTSKNSKKKTTEPVSKPIDIARENAMQIVKLLVERGADLNHVNAEGWERRVRLYCRSVFRN